MSVLGIINRLFGPKPPPPPPEPVAIVQRDVLRLTVAQWRSTPGLVSKAAQALDGQPLRAMLDVLWNEHIGRLTPQLGADPSAVADHYQRAAGWSLCLRTLESLGTMDRILEAPKATFASTNLFELTEEPK